MPRARKEINLQNLGVISKNPKSSSHISLDDNTNPNTISKLNIFANSIQIPLNEASDKSFNKSSGKLSFKKSNFNSKFRSKEKNARIAKNIKNMVQDTLDCLSYNQYQSIEAGPTWLPKKKYCDITGFESNYRDPRTGLRFYNSELFKVVSTLTEPIKNQYLSMRKALFIIK